MGDEVRSTRSTGAQSASSLAILRLDPRLSAGHPVCSLRQALPALDPRSREIIERRWLGDDAERPTLQELGEHFGISAERVRQLEARALQRLRGLLLPHVGEDIA